MPQNKKAAIKDNFESSAMDETITLKALESLLTNITSTFTDSLNKVVQQFHSLITEVVNDKFAAINTRLEAIENKLKNDPCVNSEPRPDLKSMTDMVMNTLVEADKQREELRRKSCNVIVSGLKAVPNVTDKALVETFCERNLTIKPSIQNAKRIGKAGDPSQIPKICITLSSPESATSLLESASLLRHSADDNAKNIYFNRDLTKAQAEAGYKARCLRRSGFQLQSTVGSRTSNIPASNAQMLVSSDEAGFNLTSSMPFSA